MPSEIDVLYVDDELSLLELGKEFLEREEGRLNIETTPHPEEAIEMLEEDGFNAVISDYQMPSMNGLELLETIREDVDSELPFIMFTGKGREEVAIDALNLGADRYLQKGGDPSSQYGMLANAVLDEAEHLETERKLMEAESRFRSIFENVPEGIVIHEMVHEDGEPVNYRLLDVNPGFEDETGIPREDAIGELATEAYNVEKPPYLDTYARVAETGEPEVLEAFFEPLDRHFYISVSSHQRGMFTTAFIDITQRKAREERMEMFQKSVEHAGHAIYVTDTEGTIEYANPAFEEVTGFSQDEVIGENPRLLKSGEKDGNYYEELWDTITSGDVWREEITNRRKDGELYTAMQTIAPITEEGEPTAYVAIQDELD